MRSLLRTAPTLAVPLLALALTPPTLADDACDVRGAPRVVAVGDVHGNYDGFVEVLQMVGLVDDEARWTGGRAHLVQTGDVLDRGPDSRKVLDLLMRLEKEAKKAGGRVHALLGNHELMNMIGDLRYVDPGEYEAFVTPRSRDLREEFFRRSMERGRRYAAERGEEFDADAYRAKLEEQAPLGFIERTQALSKDGKYGRWLRKRNVVTKVNGVVFLHGGLSPEVAALGCKAINETARRELTKGFKTMREDPLASFVGGENGPLWYRGLAREDEVTFAPVLDQILQAMEARAVAVGHTVTVTGRLQSRFGGRVVLIDAGMSEAYKDSRAALEIAADGAMTAVYPDAREAIAAPEAGETEAVPAAASGGV